LASSTYPAKWMAESPSRLRSVPTQTGKIEQTAILRARKVRTWLPDRSLISVKSYWEPILRIWDLAHLDEHCGKEGSSTRQNTCEYHAGDPFGIVSDQPTILLAKSQGRSQYVVQFRDDDCFSCSMSKSISAPFP